MKNINNRIALIREILCDNNNREFAEKLGTSDQYASNICKSGKNVGEKTKTKILETFPEINKIWLLTGEGEMLKGESQGSGDVTSGSGDKITIPLSAWNVIEKQAESLAARDRQMELLMKSRDEQINQLISTVRREIADLKKTYVHTEAATFADAG